MQISFPALQPLLFLASNEIVRTVQVVKVRAAGKKGKKWEKNVKQKVLLCTVWYKRIRLQIQSQIYPKVPKVTKSTYRAKSCLNYQMYQVYKMLSKVHKGTKSTKKYQGTSRYWFSKIFLYSYENKHCCMPSSWKGYCKTTNQWLQHYDSDCSVNYILF